MIVYNNQVFIVKIFLPKLKNKLAQEFKKVKFRDNLIVVEMTQIMELKKSVVY